jgi:hypothetical protein
MSNLNLEVMRKKIYKTYFSDGIWDIVLGMVYLIFGLGVLITQDIWYLFPILITLPLALKRSVSEPRVGTLQFKKSQKTRLLLLYFLFSFLVLGFVIFLGILNPSGDMVIRWLTINLFFIVGLIIAVILALVGWLFNFSRMYLYAILNLIGFALIGKVTSVGVILTILGTIFTVIGLIVLRNFVKFHPKLDLSEDSEVLQ